MLPPDGNALRAFVAAVIDQHLERVGLEQSPLIDRERAAEHIAHGLERQAHNTAERLTRLLVRRLRRADMRIDRRLS